MVPGEIGPRSGVGGGGGSGVSGVRVRVAPVTGVWPGNNVMVEVTSNVTDSNGILVRLRETTQSSGRYRGTVDLRLVSHYSHSWIGTNWGEKVTVTSVDNAARSDSVDIPFPLKITPANPTAQATEDQGYSVTFSASGGTSYSWSANKDAGWLTWTSCCPH